MYNSNEYNELIMHLENHEDKRDINSWPSYPETFISSHETLLEYLIPFTSIVSSRKDFKYLLLQSNPQLPCVLNPRL